MHLGFIGTGTIAAALVTGLSRGPNPPPIVLSPRSEVISTRLAATFPNVRRATSNAEAAKADIVVLAMRPTQVDEALAGITFSPDQIVVSLVAGLPLAELKHFAPNSRTMRAIPLPGAARGVGPITLYPGVSEVTELFAPLGDLFVVESEAALQAGGLSAFMSSYFELQSAFITHSASGQLSGKMARDYVVSLLGMLADTTRQAPPEAFEHLVVEHQTKGGLNERVRAALLAEGWFDTARKVLQSSTTLTRKQLD